MPPEEDNPSTEMLEKSGRWFAVIVVFSPMTMLSFFVRDKTSVAAFWMGRRRSDQGFWRTHFFSVSTPAPTTTSHFLPRGQRLVLLGIGYAD